MEGLYEKPSGGIVYSPFNLKIDEMERLILLNFEKDPDEIYVGFEPQYFEDDVHGKGLRVIAWRRDGYVDVYQQPGLSMSNRNFDVAGKGLADLLQRPMENARCSITEVGVDVCFAFEDKTGRPVEVLVKENGKKPAKTFDLLAPVGSSSESPSSFPIFFLYGFYFIRRSNTQVKISIGDIEHRPDNFPIPMDGSRIYFMRYSKDPLLGSWNGNAEGLLPGLELKNGMMADEQGTIYDMEEHDGHQEIRRMRRQGKKHSLNISFSPAVPDIACLKDQVSVEGKFVIESDESAGTIGGDYRILRNGTKVEIQVEPTGGWQPGKSRWMVGLIYKMASIFRNWPKSYIWTNIIELRENDSPVMKSYWRRK